MRKLNQCICMAIILLTACYSNKTARIDLMVYSVFPNPQKVFDSVQYHIQSTGIVDSITITGQPIMTNSINYRIDTTRLKQYGISMEAVNQKISSYSSKQITVHVLDSLAGETIATINGQEIPFGAIASLYIEKSFYKPQIYKPVPQQYIYQGRRAVKISLYCRKGDKKFLMKQLPYLFQLATDKFMYKAPDFEIVTKQRE